jgi:AAA+ ATPase superfamily predicted ATPase
MKFNQFIDRQDSLKRLRNALLRTTPQFLVIYGRRRIGKSTLIKEIMQDKDVYFLSDQTNEANQRALFAKAIAYKPLIETIKPDEPPKPAATAVLVVV